jgi:hypothetical protein
MTQTLIMIAQGLDHAIVKEGITYALSRKISDAARDVDQAFRKMQSWTPAGEHTTTRIISECRNLRPLAAAAMTSLDTLEAVIEECQAVWDAITPPAQKPDDDEEEF